jgi:hypothetical protein
MPSKQIPTRKFIFWLGSVWEEEKNNIKKAIKYCEAYLDIDQSVFMKNQYKRLRKI